MRRCFLLLACLFLPWSLGAATNVDGQETLFNPPSLAPAQGGPALKWAFFPTGAALLSGGIGALALRGGLGLGVGAYSLSSEFVPVHGGVKHDLGFSYYGILLDYSFYPGRLTYLNVSAMAGPAQGWSVPRLSGAERVYLNFGFIEPGINLMLNATPNLRVGVGASYRFFAGADLLGDLGADLQGPALSLTILYGKI